MRTCGARLKETSSKRGLGMIATDPADVAVTFEGAPGPAANGADASPAVAADEAQRDEQAILRIVNMPRDVGWMMVSVASPALRSCSPGLPCSRRVDRGF